MRIVEVVDFERIERDGVETPHAKVDAGDGDTVRVEHFGPPGDDSPPLPGDMAQLVETSGAGAEAAVGYQDVRNAGAAAKGEKRLCGRSPDGTILAVVWLKGDGTIEISNAAELPLTMAPNGDVTIKGNLLVEGEVTAKSGNAATAVNLSTHPHPTGIGPTGAPTAGV